MANGTRTWTLLVVLVIGLAVGWFIGHGAPAPPPLPTPTPAPGPGPNPGNHLIKVGPNAGNVGAVISKSGKHMIFWKTRDVPAGVAKLRILFKKSDYPQNANGEPPFENGVKNMDQVFECDRTGVCKSGAANPNLTYPPDSYYYKYWQIFLDASGNIVEQADAGIIIEP